MAKTDKGIFGVSGKLGPVVFFEKYGKTFVRTAPQFTSKRTFTPKQLVAKAKFAKANKLMRYLSYIAEQTYIEQKGKGSTYHKMLGQINKFAIKGDSLEEIQIVPELLPISFGSLIPDASFTMTENEEGFHINWDAEVGAKSDTVSLIVLAELDFPNNRKKTHPFEDALGYKNIIHSSSKRADKQLEINKSDILPDKYLRVWIYAYFSNADKSLCSPSSYLGKVELDKV